MRAPANLLHGSTAGLGEPSPLPSSLPPPHPEQQQTAPVMAMDSDMVVILASLLCALVCVLGLGLVSRCVCGRRRSNSTSSSAPLPPKGLKKKAIDALPTVSFTGAGASPQSSSSAAACSLSLECAICLTEFTDGESVRVLPRCGHNFHVACVDAWLRTCATCPSCRAPIVVAPAQPPVGPTVVVVVAAANNRCRRCGELEAPADDADSTFLS